MAQNPAKKKYYCLEPAYFRLDGGAMFGIIPKPLWEKKSPPDEQNRINLALRLLLIQSRERVVLIDTGIGDYHDEKFNKMFDVRTEKNPLEKALAKISLDPEDVTDLVMSHLHFDHIGGIGKEDENGNKLPVLPNARCHVHHKHYEYAHEATERDKGSFHVHNFEPILDYYNFMGKLHWLEGEEGEIIPEIGLNFKASFGHTPWMIHPYDENVLYLADLIPTSQHIHIPWVMGFDISAGETTEYKKEFLDFISKEQLNVVFEHDPEYWGGKIEQDEKGKFKPHQLASIPQVEMPRAYPLEFSPKGDSDH